MPSQKILEQKTAAVEALSEKLGRAASGVLVKYQGITVEQDTKLRAALRGAGVEYSVIKNTMIGRACEKAGLTGMDQYLEGMNALAISYDDPVAPAKILKEYA
ncbi:MAG: 50S ribosomal protein L10, partial [Clostridia bacterium]|nr:50S ribosomal protein L10 [Clostridia bacterium]